MNAKVLYATISVCIVITVGCSTEQKAKRTTTRTVNTVTQGLSAKNVSEEHLNRALSGWSVKAEEVARKTVEMYGLPNEATKGMLVWYDNRPWKRTIVYREEVTHLFPQEHVDVLQQFVDLKVDPDKVDDLARFDGSIFVDRTKGEISVRGGSEEMNFLALNLAKEIIDGKRTVADARLQFASMAADFNAGRKVEFTRGLQFSTVRSGADPDRSVWLGDIPNRSPASVIDEVEKDSDAILDEVDKNSDGMVDDGIESYPAPAEDSAE